MLAVESLRDRVGERLVAEVAGQHCRPRDRLQRGPVQPRRQDERNDHQKFSKTRKHDGNLNRHCAEASKI